MRPREIEHAIKQHYSDPNLDLDTLAEALHVKTSFLHDLVQRYLACTPRCLIETVRLEQAILLVGDSDADMSLYAVCREIGYNSTKTFRRAFKKRTNLSPQAFRLQLAQAPDPQAEIDAMIDTLWQRCRRW
jgi:two-component system response regulator YesN